MSDNREKYEAFGILDLKAMARTRGMKGAYRLKKKELIDAMVARDAEEAMAAGETERVEQNNEVDAPVEADRGVQNDTEEERRDYGQQVNDAVKRKQEPEYCPASSAVRIETVSSQYPQNVLDHKYSYGDCLDDAENTVQRRKLVEGIKEGYKYI